MGLCTGRLVERATEKMGQDDTSALKMEKFALYYGRTSLSVFDEVRGNGVLLLTDRYLWFSRLTPRLDIQINLEEIADVRAGERFFKGKSAWRNSLVVVRVRTGEEFGWATKNAREWQEAIHGAMEVAHVKTE